MASPAPALDRGIDILEWLQNNEGATLESLSTNLRIPKSSALRFLDTLTRRGIVSRDPLLKTYQCRKILIPLNQDSEEQLFHIREAIQDLCQRTQRTVEYYRPEGSGARLAERIDPPNQEVQIIAGLGFFRDWFPELEAVAVTALAHSPVARLNHRLLYRPGKDGPMTPLSLDEAEKLIQLARKNGVLTDPHFNNFGVRRMAAPLFREGKLVGILALAEHYIPSRKPTWNSCSPILRRAAARVFSPMENTSSKTHAHSLS